MEGGLDISSAEVIFDGFVAAGELERKKERKEGRKEERKNVMSWGGEERKRKKKTNPFIKRSSPIQSSISNNKILIQIIRVDGRLSSVESERSIFLVSLSMLARSILVDFGAGWGVLVVGTT